MPFRTYALGNIREENPGAGAEVKDTHTLAKVNKIQYKPHFLRRGQHFIGIPFGCKPIKKRSFIHTQLI